MLQTSKNSKIPEAFGIISHNKILNGKYLNRKYEHFNKNIGTYIVQKNTLFRKGIGIQNFSGPCSYSLERNRNYSFILIPLKGKEYLNLAEF